MNLFHMLAERISPGRGDFGTAARFDPPRIRFVCSSYDWHSGSFSSGERNLFMHVTHQNSQAAPPRPPSLAAETLADGPPMPTVRVWFGSGNDTFLTAGAATSEDRHAIVGDAYPYVVSDERERAVNTTLPSHSWVRLHPPRETRTMSNTRRCRAQKKVKKELA